MSVLSFILLDFRAKKVNEACCNKCEAQEVWFLRYTFDLWPLLACYGQGLITVIRKAHEYPDSSFTPTINSHVFLKDSWPEHNFCLVEFKIKTKVFLATFRKQNKIVFYSLYHATHATHAIIGRGGGFYFNTLKLDEATEL